MKCVSGVFYTELRIGCSLYEKNNFFKCSCMFVVTEYLLIEVRGMQQENYYTSGKSYAKYFYFIENV